MGAGGRARLLAAWLPAVLMGGAGTVSGVLVSTQLQQHEEQHQVLGVVVGKSRHGGGGGNNNTNSRLRGAGISTNPSLGSAGPPSAMTATTAFIELPRAEEAEQEEARMKEAGGSDESGGRGWGADGKQGSRHAGVSAGAGPREEGVAAGARAQEAKQGSRRPSQQDDTVSDHDSSGQGVTVIAACIGALIAFSVVWCWLSSVFVCVSWCVCKCARPSSRHSSSSCTENKQVDTYAGAVRATFCGSLASVVCVSDGDTAEKNDTDGQEEGFPASLPCTPRPSTSIGTTSSSEKLGDEATAVTRAGVTADAPPAAINGAAATNIDGGAVSSYAAFSGIFRRALTATALPPDTPTANGSPSVCDGAQLRQQQHGLDGSGGDGTSDENPLALCPNGDGGGCSGDIALVWGEEKQSENGSHTTNDPVRPRGRPFLRSSGGASGGTLWAHRFWARFSGDNCRNEAGRRLGTGGGPASGVSDGSPGRSSGENGSPEGSLGEGAAFEGRHGLVDVLSHRRRVARWARLAGGSRAQERGRGSGDGRLASASAAAAAAEPDSGGGNNSRSRGDAAGCVAGATTDRQVSPEPAVPATPAPPEAAAGSAPRSTPTNNNDGAGGEATAAGGAAAAAVSRAERGFLPRGGGVAEDAGNGDGERGEERGSRPPGDTESISPGLPRARMLWRAFSEVDHNKIEDNHRRAAQRHLARFGPAPGVRNPPMCYGPI